MAKLTLESQAGLRQEMKVIGENDEPFVLYADEPISVGGGGTAPSPYEFLIAAVASCVSITVRMYADRKGIPLKHVSIEIRHDKKEDEATGQKIDLIRKRLTFQGDLSDEQIERLKEIADKCPVSRTLQNTVRMETVASRA